MSRSIEQADVRAYAHLRNNRAHGQDACWAGEAGDYICLAVADGVTSFADSGPLAKQVVTNAKKAFQSHYSGDADPTFNNFLTTLLYRCKGIRASRVAEGRTTISLLIVDRRPVKFLDEKLCKIEYYCLGDSPIIACRQQPLSPEFPRSFVCSAIHDQPLVTDTGANLYSWFDGATREPQGCARSGTVLLREDDICLVMTDGVPLFPAIVKDIENDFAFLNHVALSGAQSGIKWLKNFMNTHPPTDDASLSVLCFKHAMRDGCHSV